MNQSKNSIKTGTLLAALKVRPALLSRFECWQADRLVLATKVDRAKYEQWIGAQICAKTIAEYWNDRVQTLEVELMDGIPFELDTPPHIVLSHCPGVTADEAAAILEDERAKWRGFNATIEARIEFYQNDEL